MAQFESGASLQLVSALPGNLPIAVDIANGAGGGVLGSVVDILLMGDGVHLGATNLRVAHARLVLYLQAFV